MENVDKKLIFSSIGIILFVIWWFAVLNYDSLVEHVLLLAVVFTLGICGYVVANHVSDYLEKLFFGQGKKSEEIVQNDKRKKEDENEPK